MTYIVTDPCIKCKFMDCVEVCPVDCFYEGENFLVIHPDECIDCGVCEGGFQDLLKGADRRDVAVELLLARLDLAFDPLAQSRVGPQREGGGDIAVEVAGD